MLAVTPSGGNYGPANPLPSNGGPTGCISDKTQDKMFFAFLSHGDGEHGSDGNESLHERVLKELEQGLRLGPGKKIQKTDPLLLESNPFMQLGKGGA